MTTDDSTGNDGIIDSLTTFISELQKVQHDLCHQISPYMYLQTHANNDVRS